MMFGFNIFFFWTIKRVGHRNITSIRQNQTHIIFGAFLPSQTCERMNVLCDELKSKRAESKADWPIQEGKKRNNFSLLWFYRGRIQFAPEIEPFFMKLINFFSPKHYTWSIQNENIPTYLTKVHARGVLRWISLELYMQRQGDWQAMRLHRFHLCSSKSY